MRWEYEWIFAGPELEKFRDPYTGSLRISDSERDSIYSYASSRVSRYEVAKEYPLAYERDFSEATQIARRGTEKTPQVDYIPSREIFKHAKRPHSVMQIQFDPKTSKVKFKDLYSVDSPS